MADSEELFDAFYDLIESTLETMQDITKMHGNNMFEYTTALELFQFLTGEKNDEE